MVRGQVKRRVAFLEADYIIGEKQVVHIGIMNKIIRIVFSEPGGR